MKNQRKLDKGYRERIFSKDQLAHVAFPMGGLGAGMIGLEGTGAFSHVSLRHKPDIFNQPLMFAALYLAGSKTARVLEGPVPMHKIFGVAGGGNGLGGSYGLPRFSDCSFSARFPFGKVTLKDKKMPLRTQLTGWSPFIPGNPDDSSLPAAVVEYSFHNHSSRTVQGIFSFHAANFMTVKSQPGANVRRMKSGFILAQPGKDFNEGYFAAFTRGHSARVDCAWFRGKAFDPLTMVWQNIYTGRALDKKPHPTGAPGGGASLYVPFKLAPNAEITIPLLMAWYVPHTDLADGGVANKSAVCKCKQKADNYYIPWYAKRFRGIAEVCEYWRRQYDSLRNATATFSRCFHDTTLPSEAVEAMAANLTILKSPTCLRQADGRLWGWEGCGDKNGCCHGSCTHVWNYAQAIPHLFPSLERGLRETEYLSSQDKRGHQNFRSALPIGPTTHAFHAAADGQLGGIIKAYREWRISGDTAWMKSLWPRTHASLDYCIQTWDPDHTGTLIEPHHNTYDIEFWGADAMCTGFYLSALKAAVLMGNTCGTDVRLYEMLLAKGRKAMESRLWNGNYFIQKIQWRNLHATSKDKTLFQRYSPEAMALLAREGPKYQYGNGCLSDGVLGDWLARVCGLNPVLDEKKTASHVDAVFRHNFRATLVDHANPQRPGYALGKDGGLLLCSWPKKRDELSLPFVYSNEVWTGIEYQVAAHLIMFGRVQKGLDIIRAVRKRYDGEKRNPFNEYECGHWYARAMSSYSLLQAFSGAWYDAVEKTLYLKPAIKGDFRTFLCTAGGYGTVGIKKGKPFLKVVSGKIDVKRIITEKHAGND